MNALTQRATHAVVDLLGSIPSSSEALSPSPQARAEALAAAAARRAAGISGGAALVPGPLGLLSLLPDIVGVWRVQAQLVADIAAVHGRSAALTTEAMMFCLFRHLVSQGLRDLVVRAGERWIVRAASAALLQRLAGAVGLRITQKSVGKVAARYAPVLGAMGVGAYAYYDTRRVARTAIELFGREVVNAPDVIDLPAQP
jgi:hypothetical protein